MDMQVWEATHFTTGKKVAVKQVYMKQPARGPSGLTDPAKNALCEIAALQTLKHPNVVSLLDVFTKVCRMPSSS